MKRPSSFEKMTAFYCLNNNGTNLSRHHSIFFYFIAQNKNICHCTYFKIRVHFYIVLLNL